MPHVLQHSDLTVTSEERILNAILLWCSQTKELRSWERVDEMLLDLTPGLIFKERLNCLNVLLPLVRFPLLPYSLLKEVLGCMFPGFVFLSLKLQITNHCHYYYLISVRRQQPLPPYFCFWFSGESKSLVKKRLWLMQIAEIRLLMSLLHFLCNNATGERGYRISGCWFWWSKKRTRVSFKNGEKRSFLPFNFETLPVINCYCSIVWFIFPAGYDDILFVLPSLNPM